jgi:hypothetical protein
MTVDKYSPFVVPGAGPPFPLLAALVQLCQLVVTRYLSPSPPSPPTAGIRSHDTPSRDRKKSRSSRESVAQETREDGNVMERVLECGRKGERDLLNEDVGGG